MLYPCALLIALVVLSACNGANGPQQASPPFSLTQANPAIWPLRVHPNGMHEGVLGAYQLLPASSSREQPELVPLRENAATQGDVYLLSIRPFLDRNSLTLVSTAPAPNGDVDYTLEFTHPFAMPEDILPPATSQKRLDLFLFDLQCVFLTNGTSSFFGGSVTGDLNLIRDPDGYRQIGPLVDLPRLGITSSNIFPYRLITPDPPPHPAGNYGTSSWEETDFLAPTGYDVFPQGATQQITVRGVSAPPSPLVVVLLAKYMDPRGGTTPSEKRANRLPQPGEPGALRYYLPEAAGDLQRITVSVAGEVSESDPAQTAMLSVQVLDWDSSAPVATTFPDPAQPTAIRQSSRPQGVSASFPDLAATSFPVSGAFEVSGAIDQFVTFPIAVQNLSGTVTVPPGEILEVQGLIRIRDEQDSAPAALILLDEALEVMAAPASYEASSRYQAVTIPVRSAVSTGQFQWVTAWGGSSWEEGKSVAVDEFGNSYTTGIFEGEVNFDPGPGVENRTSQGLVDAFLLALDPAGAFRWIATWGTTSRDEGLDVALDASGNPYVTGFFRGTVDFDPGPGEALRTSIGSDDPYLLALDSTGNFRWVAAWGGPARIVGNSVVVGPDHNVYVTGNFPGTADFDPGPGVEERSSTGNNDCYLLSLDAAGGFRWVATWGGTDLEGTWDLAVDGESNLYIAGEFDGLTDFDPGAGVESRASNGNVDAFLLSLDSTSAFRWVATWGSTEFDNCVSVALDSLGQPFATGSFAGTVDFDPSAGVVQQTSQDGSPDAYLLALAPDGSFRWVASWGGEGWDEGRGVALDPADNPRVTGWFEGTVDFDPGAAVTERSSQGGYDAFLLELSASGNFAWVATFGGTAANWGSSTAVDGTGNTYVTGPFSGTVDFDPDAGVETQASRGGYDAFLLKLAPP
ncbi:MAG: hypothetical protein GEEBNDBF_00468 [bacterium]|nr:hypothetical protein [bacterium]